MAHNAKTLDFERNSISDSGLFSTHWLIIKQVSIEQDFSRNKKRYFWFNLLSMDMLMMVLIIVHRILESPFNCHRQIQKCCYLTDEKCVKNVSSSSWKIQCFWMNFGLDRWSATNKTMLTWADWHKDSSVRQLTPPLPTMENKANEVTASNMHYISLEVYNIVTGRKYTWLSRRSNT